MKAKYVADPHSFRRPEIICTGSERDCCRAAAKALGRTTLRGCPQAPSAVGTVYYAPGHGDDTAPYVELVY